MEFKITHETTYVFEGEVFLEPHALRFRPKQTPFIELTRFSSKVNGPLQGKSVIEDEEHNIVDFCWFDELTHELKISVQSSIRSKDFNPFNFLIYPATFNTLPFKYSDHQALILRAALKSDSLSPELRDYADAVLQESQHNTVAFISNLTAQIHKDFLVEYREDGAPHSPDHTFTIKRGSCRDLSWMLINLLRQVGIASRFVSGYFYFEMEKPSYELHAWVEVFIPGTGWIGLDPSHGILTGSTHFPLASSALPENTMPVTGSIRGSASSQMTTNLVIEKL